MSDARRPFSDDEVREMVRVRNRDGLDMYLESVGVLPEVRAFFKGSKPNREGTATRPKLEYDRQKALFKGLFDHLVRLGWNKDDAFFEACEKVPLKGGEGIADRIANNKCPDITDLSRAIQNPFIADYS